MNMSAWLFCFLIVIQKSLNFNKFLDLNPKIIDYKSIFGYNIYEKEHAI